MNNFFSNFSMLFLEDDATPEQTEDYSIDMEQPQIEEETDTDEENIKEENTENTTPEKENKNEEEDDMDLGEESEDYSIDMEQPTDTEEETDEENDTSLETSEEENKNDESRYKKYKLLSLYKEILNDINKLSNSLKSFRDSLDSDLEQHQLFIEEKINNLKEKIEFTLRNDYLIKEYEELLTSYLYFREELDAIVELISKLINYNNE